MANNVKNKKNKLTTILVALAVILLVAAIVAAIVTSRSNTDYRDMDTYINLTETQAIDRAEDGGLAYRIVERDGESYMVTQDYSDNRVNFTIANDHVTKAEIY